MEVINLNTIVSKKKQGLLISELGNELVMMDIDQGNYIGLNETGKAIWELLDEPTSVEALIKKLVSLYEISIDECRDDTLEYLNKMNEQKLLEVKN